MYMSIILKREKCKISKVTNVIIQNYKFYKKEERRISSKSRAIYKKNSRSILQLKSRTLLKIYNYILMENKLFRIYMTSGQRRLDLIIIKHLLIFVILPIISALIISREVRNDDLFTVMK